ncbi:hypothetical protein K505DRAFT_87349 [Melanomma pulvis-pyrius CBS 109.77]|uniref:Uncharacterized protein n=1 Tax=Melanomma pulvis-pyrius CBS 109.77 TaxID=1314802 RepID=A0A6A6XQS2_9PLEO|nr:hypothetical protein K505DRAFT_87349 [Melanomma pulvis-pyrius CBS 109.77]
MRQHASLKRCRPPPVAATRNKKSRRHRFLARGEGSQLPRRGSHGVGCLLPSFCYSTYVRLARLAVGIKYRTSLAGPLKKQRPLDSTSTLNMRVMCVPTSPPACEPKSKFAVDPSSSLSLAVVPSPPMDLLASFRDARRGAREKAIAKARTGSPAVGSRAQTASVLWYATVPSCCSGALPNSRKMGARRAMSVCTRIDAYWRTVKKPFTILLHSSMALGRCMRVHTWWVHGVG